MSLMNVGRLPDNVGFTGIAPILCGGVTVYKGLKKDPALHQP